jgi:hypothetical protein
VAFRAPTISAKSAPPDQLLAGELEARQRGAAYGLELRAPQPAVVVVVQLPQARSAVHVCADRTLPTADSSAVM